MNKFELDRRPGIRTIVLELRIAHPLWSKEQIYTEAKVRWTQRYRNEKSAANPRPQ
jgi:hypothetical protein